MGTFRNLHSLISSRGQEIYIILIVTLIRTMSITTRNHIFFKENDENISQLQIVYVFQSFNRNFWNMI